MSGKEGQVKVDASILITFIERTKDGEYAPIVEDSLQYARLEVRAQPTYDPEDDYYYSFS